MTISTIGIHGTETYSTTQTWNDAAPSTLTAQWIGQVTKGELVDPGQITIGGSVSTSDFFKKLMARPGDGFNDDVGIGTNPVRYDASKGAAIRGSGNGGVNFIAVQESYFQIESMQVKRDDTTTLGAMFSLELGADALLNKCILDSVSSYVYTAAGGSSPGIRMLNCVVTSPSVCDISAVTPPYTHDFCTFVSPRAVGGRAFRKNYGTGFQLRNSAVLNYAQIYTAQFDSSGSSNNLTDLAVTLGSASVQSAAYDSSLIASVSTTAFDLRPVSGSVLVGAGTPISGVTDDIFRNPRDPANPTIGAVEFSAGSSSGVGTAAGSSTAAGVGESGGVVGAFTFSSPADLLRNMNNAPWASTSVAVRVYDVTSGELVHEFSTATDSTGLLPTLSHSSIVQGTVYDLLYKIGSLTTGARGISFKTAS